MKQLLIACAIATPVTVLAEPAKPEPTRYLEGGVTGGFAFGPGMAVYGAGSIESGLQVRGPLWLHTLFADGALAGVDGYGMTLSSMYLQARAGVELRTCTSGRVACIGGGVDLGYRHESLIAADDTIHDDSIVAVPRAILDLGGANFRFRTSFEFTINRSFGDVRYSGWGGGIGLVTGVAYAF